LLDLLGVTEGNAGGLQWLPSTNGEANSSADPVVAPWLAGLLTPASVLDFRQPLMVLDEVASEVE
jgi:hypothetical protein